MSTFISSFLLIEVVFGNSSPVFLGYFKALLWMSAALCSVLCQDDPTLLQLF